MIRVRRGKRGPFCSFAPSTCPLSWLLLTLWGIFLVLTYHQQHPLHPKQHREEQLRGGAIPPPIMGREKISAPIASTNSSLTIAVVVVLKKPENIENYALALSTLRCYAGLQNYPFYLFYVEHRADGTESEWERAVIDKCLGSRLEVEKAFVDGRQGQFMFDRICVLAEFLAVHHEHDYVLYLDADIGVINPERRIEEFIDTKREANFIFYERETTWEIAAGAFIARNTVLTRKFLAYWYNYTWEMARQMDVPHDSTFAYLKLLNRDQGALHRIFMEMFATAAEKEKCDAVYFAGRGTVNMSRSVQPKPAHLRPRERTKYVPNHVACVRHFLKNHHNILAKRGADLNFGGDDQNHHQRPYYFFNETAIGLVKVLAKYAGFIRDGTIDGGTMGWSEDLDFMLHGWKEEYVDLAVDLAWTRPITGEEPFDYTQCSVGAGRSREEVVQRFWRDRYRRELMMTKEELTAIFEKRRLFVQAKFEKSLEEALNTAAR